MTPAPCLLLPTPSAARSLTLEQASRMREVLPFLGIGGRGAPSNKASLAWSPAWPLKLLARPPQEQGSPGLYLSRLLGR